MTVTSGKGQHRQKNDLYTAHPSPVNIHIWRCITDCTCSSSHNTPPVTRIAPEQHHAPITFLAEGYSRHMGEDMDSLPQSPPHAHLQHQCFFSGSVIHLGQLLLKETSTSTGQAYRRGADTLERELRIPWATSGIRWDRHKLHHTQLRSSRSTAAQHQRSLPRRRSSQSTAAAPTPTWAL